nr:tripeptidyl-peptidase 2 [Quercus suber]
MASRPMEKKRNRNPMGYTGKGPNLDNTHSMEGRKRFQPITAKDEFSFSVETVLPSHGFQPMGVYHVGLFDGVLPFVNVACGPREDVIRLSFFSQPDGPVMGNGAFKTSLLVPGILHKDHHCWGTISYGKLSFGQQEEGKNPLKNPVSYQLSYIVPPNQLDEDKGKGSSSTGIKTVSERLEEELDEDKGKGSSSTGIKTVSERLEEEVRDAKIKVLSSLKQDSDEERSECKKLSVSLKVSVHT